MIRRLVSALSLLVGLSTVLAVAPLSAGASSALATMTVTTRDDPLDPQLLSTSVSRSVSIGVDADGATDVTVTFSGVGLTIDTPVVNLGTVTGDGGTVVEVTATSGGFHTLNIQVTSTNSAPVSASLPRMWAPGGAPLAATGDLSGRNYANGDLYTANGTSFPDRQALTFLDEELAFIGFPDKGRPVCTKGSDTKTKGCVTYRYDTATGLVQIGGTIGRVLPKSIYTNGIGRPDEQGADEDFNARTFTQRISYAAPGKRYGRTWTFRYTNYPQSQLTFVKLTLRKNGTFELRYSVDNDTPTVRGGSYQLTAPGRLRLKGAFGTELHTFAVRAKANGKADPSLGVWFTIGKGANPEGVPLKP